MQGIKLNTDGPVFGMNAKAGDWLVLMNSREHENLNRMTVRELTDGYLWRLNNATEGGFCIVLLPGGDIQILHKSTVVFQSKNPSAVAEQLTAMTIPSRVRVEFSRDEAEQLKMLVSNRCLEIPSCGAVSEKLDAALKEGLPS